MQSTDGKNGPETHCSFCMNPTKGSKWTGLCWYLIRVVFHLHVCFYSIKLKVVYAITGIKAANCLWFACSQLKLHSHCITDWDCECRCLTTPWPSPHNVSPSPNHPTINWFYTNRKASRGICPVGYSHMACNFFIIFTIYCSPNGSI